MKVKNEKAIEVTLKLGVAQDSRGVVCSFHPLSTGYTSVITEDAVKEGNDGGLSAVKKTAAMLLSLAVEMEKSLPNGS